MTVLSEPEIRAKEPSILKVLITTSGVGSRLGEFTSYTNKSLVKVGDKPALSYIVEKYPIETNYVITLGHFGEQVRDFLTVVYPDRKFQFVDVSNYQGVGSSLGLSLLSAAEHLQEPFIFHASDTLVFDNREMSIPVNNWVGGSKGTSASHYASLDVSSGLVMKFHDKGKIEFDFLHIGLVGVHDFRWFWTTLQSLYSYDPLDTSLNDLSVLMKMKEEGATFFFKEFASWFDMGNTESLFLARKELGQKHEILEKADESISFFGDSVVKFFANEKIAEDRVSRAKSLGNLVPEVSDHKGSFYKYDYVEGKLASKWTTPKDIRSLLGWSEANLWLPLNDFSEEEFLVLCQNFYKDKTFQRVKAFLVKSKYHESSQTINGLNVPGIFELLSMIDFAWLSTGVQSQFHGDFILDNILRTSDGFKLLDWRQDFGGSLTSGDMYYDLAKLNHSFVMNHEVINSGQYHVSDREKHIYCDIFRKHELVVSAKVLRDFVLEKKLDWRKVQFLTSLIWLNMAPLHHHPFDIFLFNFGKLNLWRLLIDEQS